MSQIQPAALFLVILIALGVLGNNPTITISAAVLLLIQQTPLMRFIPLVEKHALNWGIILLTIGVLSPLVSGRVQIPTQLQSYFNVKMLVSILVGVVVAWLAGRGVPFMSNYPTMVTGLIIGTIIGVSFFGGVPVGPLIAAGVVALLLGKL